MIPTFYSNNKRFINIVSPAQQRLPKHCPTLCPVFPSVVIPRQRPRDLCQARRLLLRRSRYCCRIRHRLILLTLFHHFFTMFFAFFPSFFAFFHHFFTMLLALFATFLASLFITFTFMCSGFFT